MRDAYVTALKMGNNLVVRLSNELVRVLNVEDRDELKISVEKTGRKIAKRRELPEKWRSRIYGKGSALQNVQKQDIKPVVNVEPVAATPISSTPPISAENVCSECQAILTVAEADFSKRRLGGLYCRKHQDELKLMRGKG